MASGSTGTPWNIPYPVGSDQYALTSDLSLLASQVGVGLSRARTQAVEEARWDRSTLAAGTDLNTVTTPGTYSTGSYSTTVSLVNRPTLTAALTAAAALEVFASGPVARIHEWSVTPAAGAAAPVLRRERDSAGAWSQWRRIDDVAPESRAEIYARVDQGRAIPDGADLNAYRSLEHAGRWYVGSAATAGTFAGDLPFGAYPFVMHIDYVNQAAWQTAWPGGSSEYTEQLRRKYSPLGEVGWSAWEPVGGGSEAPSQTAQRDMLLQRSRVRHGGRIGTGGKTVVALSFDHGFANFRDYVLPELVRLGLPATVAVNTATLGSGENAGVSYPELQGWAIEHGIELANHSRSHSDAVGDAAITDAILGSLTLLHANCPEVAIDAYIMPGVSGTGYEGFDAGARYSDWWDHVAGRTILQNHAAVTSLLPGQAMPLDGVPVLTAARAGWDSGSWAAETRARIGALEGTGMGINIYMHPSAIGSTITPEQVTTMLEWLASERDAGRVEVLTVSGAAWADAGSSRRADLGAGAAWSGGSATLTLAPLREWARGSQWCLSADVTAGEVLSVVDDTGLLDASITTTAAGRARLFFTIPASAETVTLSIGAGTAPRVEPV